MLYHGLISSCIGERLHVCKHIRPVKKWFLCVCVVSVLTVGWWLICVIYLTRIRNKLTVNTGFECVCRSVLVTVWVLRRNPTASTELDCNA